MCADRSSRRREMDFMKLMNGPRRVHPSESVSEFWVEFRGPEGTPYEDGVWYIHVNLPDDYPFKSPSIGFSNRIFHPNVDEVSGSVCLDVINQAWTPMYELHNIFDVFLPQLLRYPNASDPLNSTAANKLIHDPIGYVTLVQDHVAEYATHEAALKGIPPKFQPQSAAVTLMTEARNISSEEDSTATPKGLTEATTPHAVSEGEDDDYVPDAIEI